MAANTDPIYTLTPNNGFCVPVLVGVASDGSGVISGGTVTMYVAFTAGTNGSYVREARVRYGSTTGIVATTGTTCIRFYLSTANSGTVTTATSHPIASFTLPALTGVLATPTPDFICPLGFMIPTGMYVLCNVGVVAATNQSWQVTVIGGDY